MRRDWQEYRNSPGIGSLGSDWECCPLCESVRVLSTVQTGIAPTPSFLQVLLQRKFTSYHRLCCHPKKPTKMLQHFSRPKVNINDHTSKSLFDPLNICLRNWYQSYLPVYPAPPSLVRGSGIGAEVGNWCRRHPATSYLPNYPLSVTLAPTSRLLFTSVSDPSKHVERSLDTNQPQRSPAGPRGFIMPPKFKGPKLPKIPICQTPETVPVPENLDKHTTITINDQKFDIEADDLEVICELGEFCQDIWLQSPQITFIELKKNICLFPKHWTIWWIH